MTRTFKRTIASLCVVLPLLLTAASAQPAAADSFFPFNYRIKASTHLKKLNQTVTVPPGSFIGKIDLDTQTLKGDIKLPPATITMSLAGIIPLVTVTVQMVEVKPVTGTVDFSHNPLPVVATSTLNIHIISAYAAGIPVNLVGDNCTTAKPVVVTMSGLATIGQPATFSGTYTIPKLKNCGVATTALNLVIPGPGNTFTATAKPK
jgi:hypothetical protein